MTEMTDTRSLSAGNLIGRLAALAIAVLLTLLAHHLWQQNIEDAPPKPIQADNLSQLGVPDAVTDCVQARMREIDALVTDGVASEQWAEEARRQAQSTCHERN